MEHIFLFDLKEKDIIYVRSICYVLYVLNNNFFSYIFKKLLKIHF